MSPLESALTAWIAFHAQLGVDIEAFLLPPATEAQIVEIEEQIGYRLPEDLRELYKIANGQWNMFDDDGAVLDVDPDKTWAPLFGNYDFMPLDKALRQYRLYLEIYTSEKEFNEKYYQANPDKTYIPTIWEVREGDAVDESGWNPDWFTFAGSDANSYAVDLSPPHGGNPGQVVLHGADEWVLQVVGQSVTDLMEQAVTHLSSEEEHRYQYSEKANGYMASLYFNMDWRAQLHIPQPQVEMPAAYTAWREEVRQSENVQREQLEVWLQGQNMPEEQRNSLMQWLSLTLLQSADSMPPRAVLMEMQQRSEAQGRDSASISLETASQQRLDSRAIELQQHITALARVYLSMGMLGTSLNIGMSMEDAINLYHRYKLESSHWTEVELEHIKKLQQDVQNMQLEVTGNLHISTVDTTLTVCTSSFDEETYKSTETCHDLDLSALL